MGKQVMQELNEHELNFDLAVRYFCDQLDCGLKLAAELIKKINFQKGRFFTLLPSDAKPILRHEFKAGGILTQPFPHYYLNDQGEQVSYTYIPNIQEEVAYLIEKHIKEQNLYCIFEEMHNSRKSLGLDYFKKNSIAFFYVDEVYYVVSPKKANSDIIQKCLQKSNAIWYSLCILSHIDLSYKTNDDFSLDELESIAANTKKIILGAYDGEGYVFWEKSV